MERSGGRGGQPRVPTREVVLAAVRLFTENGFEATTMDQIAADSGVSRRSLFRRFGSKEDILFAGHDELFSTVAGYLRASPDEPLTTVFAAARLVLQDYLGDPEVTLPRYRLVRAHPRLRDREVAMTARYQAAFSRYLARHEGTESGSPVAEMVAASLIAAHNHVLRGWLRDPDQDGQEVLARFEEAMSLVRRVAEPMLHAADGPGDDRVLVAVYPGGMGREELLRRIGAAVQESGRV